MRLQKSFPTIMVLLLVVLIFGAVNPAAAQVPGPRPNVVDGGNRWLITYFNDCDVQHTQWATQGICFLPYKPCGACGIQGAWYSDTFPDWNGMYMQEGDRIVMHGDYAQNVGHDGMFIDLFAGTSPRDEGAGQWTEWREAPGFYGLTIGFGNTRLRRVGKCELPHNNHVAQSNDDINKLAEELSRKVKPRMRRDGKPAESPIDPEQVPLKEESKF
ncbi:MAG TPA: hypothetical protein VLL54_12415 [Pyrinomonadaceae bacterium]|nr:hypothetical protein [Pyrinomonadaceae bacterium]